MIRKIVTSIFLLTLIAPGALAEGVIVVGKVDSEPHYFYNFNQPSKRIALTRAMKDCSSKASYCVLETYIPSRSWVAIATDGQGAKAWFYSADYNETYQGALEQCNKVSEDESCDIFDIKFSY